MGKAVTRGQALELVGQFSRDTNWDTLTSEETQAIIDLTPEERSMRFTAFLKNGASLTVMNGVAAEITPAPVVLPNFTAWRRFCIGGFNNKDLLWRVQSGGVGVSSSAERMMNNRDFTTLAAEEKIDTIILTPEDFGYTRHPTTVEFFDPARLAEWSQQNVHRLPEGYDAVELLPAEAGPHIRDQYKDQAKREVLWIAMERIEDSGGVPRVFAVERRDEGKQLLNTGWTSPVLQWSFYNQAVFRLRKKVAQD